MISDPRDSIKVGDSRKLAFTSKCLPGSEAEKAEQDRLAEFQEMKSRRDAQQQEEKPERDARRQQEYLEASEANRERMRKGKAARTTHPDIPR